MFFKNNNETKVKAAGNVYGLNPENQHKEDAAITIQFSSDGKSVSRVVNGQATCTLDAYGLGLARDKITTWNRLCVGLFDNKSGKLLSSQVIFFNKKIRETIESGADSMTLLQSILSSRKAAEGKKIVQAKFVREPLALTDPQSGEVYGCNILVALA